MLIETFIILLVIARLGEFDGRCCRSWGLILISASCGTQSWRGRTLWWQFLWLSWTVLMLLSVFAACPPCEVNQKSDWERAGKEAAGAEAAGIQRGRRYMLGVCRGFCCSGWSTKTTNLMFALEVLKPSGSEPKHPRMHNKYSAVLEHFSLVVTKGNGIIMPHLQVGKLSLWGVERLHRIMQKDVDRPGDRLQTSSRV